MYSALNGESHKTMQYAKRPNCRGINIAKLRINQQKTKKFHSPYITQETIFFIYRYKVTLENYLLFTLTNTDSNGNDQDDIVWADGTISDGTATFEVKTSDHSNELGYYRTHIYAYDRCGNYDAVAVPDIYIENTKPIISNVKIINQTST